MIEWYWIPIALVAWVLLNRFVLWLSLRWYLDEPEPIAPKSPIRLRPYIFDHAVSKQPTFPHMQTITFPEDGLVEPDSVPIGATGSTPGGVSWTIAPMAGGALIPKSNKRFGKHRKGK